MKRKLIALLLVAALAVLAMPSFVSGATDTVTIYHTNDMHAYIESEYDEDGNLTKLGLEHVAALRAANENSILVDAGDYEQGSLFGNLAHGLSVYEAMNAAGYEVVALGNHEFDWGVDEFEKNAAIAEFQILSANVTVSADKAATSPYLASMPLYIVKEVGGHKIAFFALDTSQLNGMVSPATLNAGGVQTRTDLSALAGEVVATIRAEAPDTEAIVCLTHCGYAEEGSTESSYDIAKVEGIDVVIDGHDHETRLGDTAKDVDGTLVVSTGTQLQHIGALDLTFSGGKVSSIKSYDAADEAKALEPNADVVAIIKNWNDQFTEIKNEVKFISEVNFWGGNLTGLTGANEEITTSIARRGYTNAGALICDARVWKAKNWLADNYAEYGLTADMPVVTITGGGSVRGSFRAGEVTLGELMSCYSFSFEDAEDTYVLITPKTLYYAIEHGVNIFKSQDETTGLLTADGTIHGRFPQVAGCSYVYDLTQPASGEYDKENLVMPSVIGTRVVSITLDDGTVLDKNDDTTKLLLVTGDYEIGGGDSYWMFGCLNDAENFGGYKKIEAIATPAGNIGDAISEYVDAVYSGTVPAADYPITSTRISRVNDPYTGTGFDSAITVTSDGAAPLADTAVTVYVNGTGTAYTTDANGLITVAGLTNGANEVRIIGEEYDSGTIYLDNYCGLVNAVASNKPGEVAVDAYAKPVEQPAGTDPLIYWGIGLAAVAALCFVFLGKKKDPEAK